MGSRHRAAIGLSQEFDAVVVVVSEETGNLSIGYRGELRAAIPADQFLQALKEALRVQRAASLPSLPRMSRGAKSDEGGPDDGGEDEPDSGRRIRPSVEPARSAAREERESRQEPVKVAS
jgi:hypothetical protein